MRSDKSYIGESNLDTLVPRRLWGGTKVSVPVLSFGTQGFGNYFGPVSDEQALLLIKRAIQLGIDLFDCSLCYGDSMRKLALALLEIPRDQVIISGRVCLHARRSNLQLPLSVDAKSADVVRNVERQLALLGTDYFDAILVHDPPDIKPTLSPGGVLSGLLECKRRGLTRWIGYGMEPPEFHMEVLKTGDVDVLLHFNDYHLLRQNAAAPGGILDEATSRNIGVMTGWSILRGLLTDADTGAAVRRGGLDNSRDVMHAQELRLWASDRNVSLLAVALQFCLRERRIHTLPIGSQNLLELEQNVQAIHSPLPANIWEELHEWQKMHL